MWQSLPWCYSHWEGVRCVLTADYDRGGWWRWHPQNYCIFISAAKKKRNLASGSRATTKQILPLSAGEIWQLSVIHDAYWHRIVYIPRGRWEGKKCFQCWRSDTGCRPVETAIGAAFPCSTYRTKYLFLSKPPLLPFNLSSWSTCPWGESQPSGEEKCCGILEINHRLLLMNMPGMGWEASAQLFLCVIVCVSDEVLCIILSTTASCRC